MPAGGDGRYLDEAVGSILGQTLADLELIVVVKPGHPHLEERLSSYVVDERVRVGRSHEPDYVARLNEGLRLARAPFIARMDTDDVARPDRLACQLDTLERDPALALVGAHVSSNVESETVRWTNSFWRAEDVAREAFIDSPIVHPTFLGRRALFERHGGYRVGPFIEDYDVILRWLRAGERLAKVPEPLLMWRRHDDTVTRRSPRCSDAAIQALKLDHLLAWRPELAQRPLGIVNAGRQGKLLLRELLARGVTPRRFFDLDPRKIGRRVRDRYPVLHHDAIRAHPDHVLLVAKGGMDSRAWIRALLADLGRVEGADYLFVR